MKKWQCKVCNYTHTGDELPESCPVCGVYRDSFERLDVDQPGSDTEKLAETALESTEQQKCSVCGYIRRDGDPPDSCPVCGVASDSFEAVTVGPITPTATIADDEAVEKKWKCTVCGYIHTGPEPPDKCPVCGADRSAFILLPPDEEDPEKKTVTQADRKKKPAVPNAKDASTTPKAPIVEEPGSLSNAYAVITHQLSKLHGHPITVHVPNGVLPVAFIFFLLGVVFDSGTCLLVSHYNLVFVLVSMPLVLFSGYNDWQIRLGGVMSQVIKTKMICALIVTGLILVLVVWRWIDPGVVAQGAGERFIFGAVFAIALVAAAVAGFFGGKLIQFPGDDKF